MTCPHLEYLTEAADRSFEQPRAYCSIADRFVQPMRADICNDRFELDHATDCEIFLASDAAGSDQQSKGGSGSSAAASDDDGGDAE